MNNRLAISIRSVLLLILLCFVILGCSSTARINKYCKQRAYNALYQYTDSRDYRDQYAIAQGLSSYNDPQTIPVLLETASYANGKTFKYILEILGRYNNKEIKSYYIEKLQDDSVSVYSKKLILEHFDNYIDETSIPIVKAYLYHNDDEMKALASETLAKAGNFEGESIVLDLLNSEYFVIQRQAVKSLGYFRMEKHVPILKTFLYDEDPIIRKNAGNSLKLVLGANYRELIAKNDYSKETKEPVTSQNITEKKQVNEIKTITESEILPFIDRDIPINPVSQPNTYALIIGNEDYSSYQRDLSSESNVVFAVRDATIFKEYLIKTFGVPEVNIIFETNARVVEMYRSIEKIRLLAKNSRGNLNIIFYYAGHGFPDEVSKEPYLIPVDVSAKDLKFAVKLGEVYKSLSEYPSKRVTIFLDACFSGGSRGTVLLAARGVKIKPKEEFLSGNMIVFAASSDEQSALPYNEKKHGIFTYHILEKFHATKGNLTYGELAEYLENTVSMQSVLWNSKEQNPQVKVSNQLAGNWKEWKFIEK